MTNQTSASHVYLSIDVGHCQSSIPYEKHKSHQIALSENGGYTSIIAFFYSDDMGKSDG